MTLSQAIFILASVHTRDDPITGFVILSGAAWRPLETPFSHVEYFEAWKVMREQSGMTVEPNGADLVYRLTTFALKERHPAKSRQR